MHKKRDRSQILKLMTIYARPFLIISGLGSLSAMLTLSITGKESMTGSFFALTFLKLVIAAIALILFKLLTSKDQEFFYINIGLHPRLLLRCAVVIDLSLYFFICILIMVFRNVIG